MIQKSVQIRRNGRPTAGTAGGQAYHDSLHVENVRPELPTENGLAGNLPSLPDIHPVFNRIPSSPPT